ncbi:Phospholipase d, pi-pxph-pld, partial [Globisporangium splendens]
MTVVSQDAPPPIATSASAATGASAPAASASPSGATAGSGRSKSVSPSGSNKSSSPAKRLGGKPFGKTHGGGFNSPPLSPSQQQSMATMGRDDSTMSRNDLTLQRLGSHYDLDFQKRDSVSNIRREVDPQSTTFFHRDFDKDIHVFTEIPDVKVLGGRSEEAWPTRYVEYDVELNYKNFKWQVEIPKSTLYGLWFFIKSQFNIKFPNAGHSHRGDYSSWPQMRKLFLSTAEKSISPEMIVLIQQYLDAVVRVPRLLSSAYVVSMFQVSNSTFDDEEGYTSVREGWLKVRIWLKGNNENVRINRGAVTCDNECFNCMCVVKRVNFKSKKWRWVALKHSSIAVYPSLQDTKATEAFLFDQKFNIERGIHSAGSNTALLVSNSTYVLQLEAKTKQSILKWANAIRKVAEKSTWSQSHRDDSFAIPRHPNQIPSYARWFVDGSDAYESIYEGICSARKEIYIAGWWICPTIHLLRPAALYPHSRLDQVLLKKAEEGVKIYILMYKEISVALTLNSNFSKQVFRRLHDNIHVLRDPDFLMKQLGMWSHHEKIVSIDQKVSFVGGLDLCFGRWDTRDHVLFDNPGQGANFLGKDYSNPRVKDFIEVHLPERDLVDRTKVPRMPWHDCHARLEGQPARDVARHFIQRWNYSVSTRRKTSKLHHLVPMKDYQRYIDKHQYSSQLLNKRLQKAVRAVQTVNQMRKGTLAPALEAGEEEKEEEEDDAETWASQSSGNRNLDADEHANANGELSPSNNSDRRGFDHDKQLSRVLSRDGITTPFGEMNDRDSEDEKSEQDEQEDEDSVYDAKRGFPCNSQILRSLSLWSGGCPTEHSIQNAYLRLISSANHFVYIENQFFVSGLDGDHGCSNRIANAIVERIRKAAANKEKFRVMVVMPLLPAFPGKPDDKDASSLRGVMYWQYRSICRGENSIYHTLFKELDGLDPFEYIAFYGLRTHSIEGGQPHTEQVYVHSKVMIVDDKSCIIGSANINERSMTGDRDSEIAVLVDDTEMDETVRIANGTASVGKFAHSFRMKLFEEHFGVEPGTPLYEKYQDPVSYHSWFAMQDHAMKNSQIYDSVFGCLPSDNVVSFKQIHLQIDPLSRRDNLPGQAKSAGQQHSPKLRARGESPANNANRSFGSPSNANSNPDAVMNDNQVEPEAEVSKSSKNKSPKSDDDSKHEGEEVDSESRNRLHELTREDSTILSGAMVTHMRENSQITVRKHELSGIQGQIVYFPLKFLADEVLEPKLFPAELFQ